MPPHPPQAQEPKRKLFTAEQAAIARERLKVLLKRYEADIYREGSQALDERLKR